MKVEIDITPFASQVLGENPARKVEELVEREAQRLWYIERSKPKEREVKPVGRPPLSPDHKRAKELSGYLEAIYRRREEQLGDEFEKVLGDEFRRLMHAIDAHDLSELERIMEEKPWLTRR